MILFIIGGILSGFTFAIGWALATYCLRHLHAVRAIQARHIWIGVLIGVLILTHTWPIALLGWGLWWLWNRGRQSGAIVRMP